MIESCLCCASISMNLFFQSFDVLYSLFPSKLFKVSGFFKEFAQVSANDVKRSEIAKILGKVVAKARKISTLFR